MKKHLSRRKALQSLGILSGGIISTGFTSLQGQHDLITLPDFSNRIKLEKAVTAITLGAGARGNVYGGYANKYPDQLNIIGVAEPIVIRNQRYCELHNIGPENSFATWERVFERPKFADAIIITTPDDLHFGPCMKALELGYDILLEKPIAPTEQECKDILASAKRSGRIVAVCHVLRYAPYFMELKTLIETGTVGEVISVQHFEPIEHIHMSHSYVRGNWHNSKKTTPIILAKSCHDLDILRWLINKPAKKISAFGSLKWFKKENQPEGATARCLDGCAVESTCPFSAKRIYMDRRWYNYVFDLPEDKAQQVAAIMKYLATTNYGRCVYDMENDQPDHYISNILFEDEVTASFSMEAFTSYHGRRTRIMGSAGDIVGDMNSFVHTDFNTGEKTNWEMTTEGKSSGHGGGDWNLVADWLQAVSSQDSTLLSSTIDASVESHIMGFRAEKSRLNGTVETIVL